MIHIPIFKHLDIEEYGLFPGRDDNKGLHINFDPGLTLILGSNGLGKTTLITSMYRMLTGPWDIPGLSARGELGGANLKPTRLSTHERRIFAQRVSDGAVHATACLTFGLGAHELRVQRSLKNLALTNFRIDGENQTLDEVDSYQKTVQRLFGGAYSDWILLLRYLVFYFEDRRSLVWDPSAQRQLLRFLFLPTSAAAQWFEKEREILELDSTVRNLQFALTRQQTLLAQGEGLAASGLEVREELKVLEALQVADGTKREEIDASLIEADARRAKARLEYAAAEQEREALYRHVERAKLIAIDARFPSQSETAKYILAQLISDHTCLVCGHNAPDAAADLEKRITSSHCVVCNSDLSKDRQDIPSSTIADKRAAKAAAKLEVFGPELDKAKNERESAEKEFEARSWAAAELDNSVSQRALRINSLLRQLPPEEGDLHHQREDLAVLRGRIAGMRSDLINKRRAFSRLIEKHSKELAKGSEKIRKAFEQFAKGFLLERCNLVWSPQRARVGQTGETIEFPAFQLDLTGADFSRAVRRSGPEEVSESQREFIDLAFRMALMEAAAVSSASSLVIDAPESSLDAVFVRRAAAVLARFADSPHSNRLVTTSNLIEGDLIPELLSRSGKRGSSSACLVDLFKIAEPTAAVRQLRDEYRHVLSAMLRKAKQKGKAPRRGVR